MATATPYWGKLPPPNVTRTNSTKRVAENAEPNLEPLTLDTNTKLERLSGQSSSRQNRHSTQTNTSIPSTFVASPTASSFRGGLAPRPASFQQSASEAAYNREYQEKTSTARGTE